MTLYELMNHHRDKLDAAIHAKAATHPKRCKSRVRPPAANVGERCTGPKGHEGNCTIFGADIAFAHEWAPILFDITD